VFAFLWPPVNYDSFISAIGKEAAMQGFGSAAKHYPHSAVATCSAGYEVDCIELLCNVISKSCDG
jgi:hypothetical protein